MVPRSKRTGPLPDGGSAERSRSWRNTRRRLKSILDPAATAILTNLTLTPRTSDELAEELAIDGEVVRRLLRRLCRSEQILNVGKTNRRGRLENLYSTDLRANVLPAEDLVGLPELAIDEADLSLLRLMFREAAEAIEVGSFQSRADRCLIRFPISLDERSFEAAIALHHRLLDDVIDEITRASARLADSRAEPIQASAFILFCESPPERRPEPSPAKVKSARRSPSSDRVERVLEFIDPFRSKLLNSLVVAPASARDLAARLEAPASKVRYELDRLLDDDLVRVIRRKPSRGTVERVFACEVRRYVLSAEDLENHPGNGAKALDSWVVRTVFSEALETIRTKTPRAVDELVIARVPMAIDAEGFAAISARIEAAVEELFELRDRCLEELGEDQVPGHLALSGTFLFERAAAKPEGA